LTKEQLSAFFREMNKQCGLQIFTYPVLGDVNYILVTVPPHLYPNFEEEVPEAKRFEEPKPHSHWLQYGDHRNTFVLPVDFFETEKGKLVAEKIRQEKWVQIEINQSSNKMEVNLNGEWLTIPESENMTIEDWQEIITQNTIGEKIAEGKFSYPVSFDSIGNNILMPVVLLPIPDEGITRLPIQNDKSGDKDGLDLLPLLRIHFISDENGKLKPIGEVFYLGTPLRHSFLFLEQGNDEGILVRSGDVFREKHFERYSTIKESGIYYLAASDSPKETVLQRSDKDLFLELINQPIFSPLEQGYKALTHPNFNEKGFIFSLTDYSFDVILIKKK